MPFGWDFGTSIYGQMAQHPRFNVGYDDLYQAPPEIAYPQAPDYADSMGDLSEEQRKAFRRQALLQAAMAIGRGSESGQIGTALAQAALQSEGMRQGMISDYRGQQEKDYQRAREEAEFQAEQQSRKISEEGKQEQARALLGLYQRVVDADPGLAGQAEAAVRTGNMSALAKLYEDVPRRQAMRDYGLNPDDPFADDQMKSRLELEEYEKRQQLELQGLPEKERIEREARLEMERQLRAADLGSYYQDPLDELERARLEQIRAGGGEGSPAALNKFYERSDGIYRVYPGEDGTFRSELVPGVPPEPMMSMGNNMGQPVLIDRAAGEAYSVRGLDNPKPYPGRQKSQEGEKKANPLRKGEQKNPKVEQSMATVAKAIGGFQTAAQREQVKKDLEAGLSPQEIVARIRRARGSR